MHYKYCYRCGDKMSLDLKGVYCQKCKSHIRKDREELSNIDKNQEVYNKAAWRNTKEEALKRADYKCEVCNVKGITPIKAADEVHHIIKVSEGSNATHYDLDNLICVCKRCHRKIEGKNKQELIEYLEVLDNAKKLNAKLYIVYGPPCSGKTTYVMENKSDEDIVIDLDYIKSALTYKDIHEGLSKDHIDYLFKIRRYMLENPKKNSITWLITTKKEYEFKDNYIEVKEINLIKSKNEIYKMIDKDDSRVDKEEWKKLVDNWFECNLH